MHFWALRCVPHSHECFWMSSSEEHFILPMYDVETIRTTSITGLVSTKFDQLLVWDFEGSNP